MKRNLQILLGVNVAVLGLIAIVYLVSSTILMTSFVALEQADTRENVARALDGLAVEVKALDSKTGDWANWDDAYRFVFDGNPEFIQINLTDTTFNQLKIDTIVFVHASGRIVFAKAFDRERQKEKPVSSSFITYLTTKNSVFQQAGSNGGLAGTMALPESAYILSAHPILTSNGARPSQGTLVFARELDQIEIDDLAQTTHLSLSMLPLKSPILPSDFRDARAKLSEQDPIFVGPLPDERVAGYTILNDIENNPVFLLRVDLPRRILERGIQSTRYLLASLIAIGLILDFMASGFAVAMVTRDENLRKAKAELRQTNDRLEDRVLERTAELATVNDAMQMEISDRKQAEQQLQLQLRLTSALHVIDMAIASSTDLRVTLTILLNQLTVLLDVDAADILLLDPFTLTLDFLVGRGFRSEALQHTHLHLGEGYAGQSASGRRQIAVPNLDEARNGFERSPLLVREGFVAYYAVPLIAKGNVKGVLEVFHRTPLKFDQKWLDFLEALASQAAVAIDSASLFDDLQKKNVDLALAYDTTLQGWTRALDLRDKETEGHTARVTETTVRLARAMGIKEGDLLHIRRGALLHDIGKMAIPDSILLKPGPLTKEEFDLMRLHPVYAHDLLFPITYLRLALDIPYYHHEKWDGTGYPRGLKGTEIPLPARIFAIVDVWDAMMSDRPYRSACTEEYALQYIHEQVGKHFDPDIVQAFLRLKGEDA